MHIEIKKADTVLMIPALSELWFIIDLAFYIVIEAI